VSESARERCTKVNCFRLATFSVVRRWCKRIRRYGCHTQQRRGYACALEHLPEHRTTKSCQRSSTKTRVGRRTSCPGGLFLRREIQHLCDGGLVLSFPPTYWLNSTKRDSSPAFSSRHRVVATNWATGTFACWSPSVSGGARDMGDGESPTIASPLRCEGVTEGGVKHVVGARCCTGDSASRWMGRERGGRPGEVPRPTGDCATGDDGGSVERPTRTWRSRMLAKARPSTYRECRAELLLRKAETRK
jgi:hypothetical protein